MKINKTLLVIMIVTMILGIQVFAADTAVLKASLSKYEPTPAEPGNYVDIYVTIQNQGNGIASNVKVELVPQFPFSAVEPSNGVFNIGILGAQTDYVAKFKVKVDSGALDGETPIKFRYTIGSGGLSYQESEFNILIRSFDSNIEIVQVTTIPKTVSPGSEFKINIDLENTAKSTLKDITLNLELEKIISGTTLIDLPFSPIGSSTQKRLPILSTSEKKVISFDLVSYPTTTSGVYKIPVSLTFYDFTGQEYTKTGIITVIVQSKPEIFATIDKSALSKQTMEGEVSFAFINKGLDDIQFATITLEKTADYEILSTSNNMYVGKIASDDFETADFQIKMNKAADQISFPLTIEYKDGNNNVYSEKIVVTQNIYSQQGTKKSSPLMTWVIIILVIVAGFFIYRKWKANKRK